MGGGGKGIGNGQNSVGNSKHQSASNKKSEREEYVLRSILFFALSDVCVERIAARATDETVIPLSFLQCFRRLD